VRVEAGPELAGALEVGEQLLERGPPSSWTEGSQSRLPSAARAFSTISTIATM
jgi:hypothetical protein